VELRDAVAVAAIAKAWSAANKMAGCRRMAAPFTPGARAPQSPLVRHRIKEHDQSVLVRGLTGYASSLAAVTGVSDLDVAMLLSRRRVGEYMVVTGRDFRDLVAAKRERRL
jgi:hypothetical protein